MTAGNSYRINRWGGGWGAVDRYCTTTCATLAVVDSTTCVVRRSGSKGSSCVGIARKEQRTVRLLVVPFNRTCTIGCRERGRLAAADGGRRYSWGGRWCASPVGDDLRLAIAQGSVGINYFRTIRIVYFRLPAEIIIDVAYFLGALSKTISHPKADEHYEEICLHY